MHLRAKQDVSAGKIWNMQASEKGVSEMGGRGAQLIHLPF